MPVINVEDLTDLDKAKMEVTQLKIEVKLEREKVCLFLVPKCISLIWKNIINVLLFKKNSAVIATVSDSNITLQAFPCYHSLYTIYITIYSIL